MKSQPLFSISTPCYNSETTIEKTLNSILIQKYTNYEYNIIDGGSTDRTLEIIRHYEPLFEGRMRWKSEQDKGLYDAFNKGVRRSNGIYCWNVNADDYIEPDVLEKLAREIGCLDSHDLPIIAGGMHFISLSGEKIKTLFPNEKQLSLAYENDFIGVPHPATLVPKQIYDKYGVFDIQYKIIGDADWYHRVYKAGVNFKLLDFVLSNMSDGGVSNQFCYKRSLKDRLYYLNKHYTDPIDKIRRLINWTRAFYSLKKTHKNE